MEEVDLVSGKVSKIEDIVKEKLGEMGIGGEEEESDNIETCIKYALKNNFNKKNLMKIAGKLGYVEGESNKMWWDREYVVWRNPNGNVFYSLEIPGRNRIVYKESHRGTEKNVVLKIVGKANIKLETRGL